MTILADLSFWQTTSSNIIGNLIPGIIIVLIAVIIVDTRKEIRESHKIRAKEIQAAILKTIPICQKIAVELHKIKDKHANDYEVRIIVGELYSIATEIKLLTENTNQATDLFKDFYATDDCDEKAKVIQNIIEKLIGPAKVVMNSHNYAATKFILKKSLNYDKVRGAIKKHEEELKKTAQNS